MKLNVLTTPGLLDEYGSSMNNIDALRKYGSSMNNIDLVRKNKKNIPSIFTLSNFKKGGKVSSASKRADGIAQRGKTKGKVC